jgi:hypothetical protein
VQPQTDENKETASLTQICSDISALLDSTIEKGLESYEKEWETLDEDTQNNVQENIRIARRHGISNNGFVPLFDFCVNPKSFGQTVENLFYVSFLIKEGRAGLAYDSNGMPTLGRPEERRVAERQQAGVQRNQAIFTLNFEVWEALVQNLGIEKSIIPHRDENGSYDDGVLAESDHQSGSRPNAGEDDEEDSDMYG